MDKIPLSRRGFLATSSAVVLGASAFAQPDPDKLARVGIIGVGNRGSYLLNVLLSVPGTSVPAICDINEENLARAVGVVRDSRGNTPDGYSRGPFDYRRMLERDDLDAVLIATPIELHAPMAVDAMHAGKHVASEVPGATTMADCHALVKAKRKTGRRYMLLENYIYGYERMMVANMCKQNVFGETYYAECAYIHDCNSLRFKPDGSLTWRGETSRDHNGNTYPTHSLGPVAKWMGINKTDRLVSLTCMDSKGLGIRRYVEKKFGPDSQQAKTQWAGGGMCVTLIKTAQDRLITVYYDVCSPRPMNLFLLIQGTEGLFDSRQGIYLDGVSPKDEWQKWQAYSDKYEHDYWKTRGEEAKKTGHGGGDYFVISDFVEMVQQNKEPNIDVYDSATWSAVTPLSQESLRKGGSDVKFPNFMA